jgi:DNA invertase Pin-like site-specific DNA recombinase
MSSDPFVSYLSPVRSAQCLSDLESQQVAVARHLGRHGRVVAEFVGDEGRPDLSTALDVCRRHGATLLMTELGEWGDDPGFLRDLGRDLRRLNLRFCALDRPEASELTLGIMAAVAEAEARLGVVRTPDTMARRREFYARFTTERRKRAVPGSGEPLTVGGRRPLSEARAPCTVRSRERAEEVAPILTEIRAAGAETLEQVAHALNALGIPAARGRRWYPMQVTRIEKRLAALV